MPIHKRQPLQPHDPYRRLDRPVPSSRSGGGGTSTFSSSSSLSAAQARPPARLAELHGNALEERREGRIQEGGKDGKGGSKKGMYRAATNKAGSMNATTVSGALLKAKESERGKRRRDASPVAAEPSRLEVEPSSHVRKRAKAVHEGAHGYVSVEKAEWGKGMLRDREMGDGMGEEDDGGEQDEDEHDDEDEAGYDEDHSESEYEDSEEDSDYDESPVTRSAVFPSMTRPKYVPVSMRLQHKLVREGEVLHEGAVVASGGREKEGKAELRDSDVEDVMDEEGVEDEGQDQDDALEDEAPNKGEDQDGEFEYDSGYEGCPEPPRIIRSTITPSMTRTWIPVSMRLQHKLLQEAEVVPRGTGKRTKRSSRFDNKERAGSEVGEEEDEEEDREDDDGEDDFSDASEECSDYDESPGPQLTRRSTAPFANGECRLPISVRLQQKAMLEREDGVRNIQEGGGSVYRDGLRRGRSSSSTSAKGADVYRVPQGIPTSTRLQEKKLRERDATNVDNPQPAIGGTARRTSQAPRRAPKRVHWDADLETMSPGNTPLSMRLQANMVQELQRRGTESVEERVIRTPDDDDGVHDGESDLTDSRDETWGGGARSEFRAAVIRGQAWLSGRRATRATEKAPRDTPGCHAEEEGDEGETVEDGGGDMAEVEGEGVAVDEARSNEREKTNPTVGSGKDMMPTSGQDDEGHESRGIDARAHFGIEGGSAADASPVASKELSQVDAQLDCREQECNAFQNRRSSSRIAGLNSQRADPLPNPPYVLRSRSLTTAPSRTSGAATTRMPAEKAVRAKKKGKVFEDPALDNLDDEAEGELEKRRTAEEVQRVKLAYPRRDRDAGPPVDYNAKRPVDWETSLGRRIAVRMQEMGHMFVHV